MACLDWGVRYMDRYEAQLHSRASSKALEVARVMIRDKIGFEAQIADRGPPRRRKKEGSLGTPEAPPLCPAALEPAWSKGKLILLSKPAESDSDSVVLATALKLLRAEIASLAEDADRDDTINQRSIACLRSVAARIPGYVPAQDELFYLAHVKEFLEAYAKVIYDKWPALLAKRFDEVTLHFDHTVRQFPKWRDFVRNAEKDRLTLNEAAEVPALANMIIAALREDEARNLVDPAIPSALEFFHVPLQSGIERAARQPLGTLEASELLLANDLLESINNITKLTAEAALEFKYFGPPNGKTNFANDAVSSVEKDSGQGYIWMIRTLLGIITSAPTLALRSKCCWLKSIVCDLRA
jgi:hypothetical protein